MPSQQCKACHYKWNSRLLRPKQCPKCRRYDWESPVIKRKPDTTEALRKAWYRKSEVESS